MIRKAEECRVEYREHMRDGDGTVQLINCIDSDAELNNKGRLFAKIVLQPGCSIGPHTHDTDTEIFYFLKGTGEYLDGDEWETVHAGDVAICPTGGKHSIANRSDEVLELMAVIAYA